MLLMFSSLSRPSSRSTIRLAVSAMFCRADDAVGMIGTSRSVVSTSRGASGLPPVSWMIGGPVRLVMDSRAWVSDFTGARASTRRLAITSRGSSGDSCSDCTVPTAMPLYCTLLPSVSPVTGSLNTTAYSCQLRSDANLAAHSANSRPNTATAMVKAPIRT